MGVAFHQIIKPTQAAIKYIKEEIPEIYRYFDREDRHWYVHSKYVENIRDFAKQIIQLENKDDSYAVMHLLPSAPKAIVEAAFKAYVKLLHPDVGGDPEEFLRIKTAYEAICKRE